MNNGGRMESARYQAIVEVQRIARCRLKERIDALAASERPPLVGYGRALAERAGSAGAGPVATACTPPVSSR